MSQTMNCVLTIAGSDCSGGAGIQADIKTISAFGLYAASAITALTAQNTTGVFAVRDTPARFIAAQIDAVFNDIPPAAIKVGMISTKEAVIAIAERLTYHHTVNVVLDPVMVATSGAKLISDRARGAIVDFLLPLATVITPNMAEAAELTGLPVQTESDMLLAAQALAALTDADVLIKGGHLPDEAADLLLADGQPTWLRAPRVNTQNTHGTGCTLSSAIACGLAKGQTVEVSVRSAKDYVTRAMSTGLDLGKGSGPLNHLVYL